METAWIGSLFFFTAVCYSIVWICPNLFIPSPVDGHLGCSQFASYEGGCYEHPAFVNTCTHLSWLKISLFQFTSYFM